MSLDISKPLIVAVSGGIDSMVLLDMLIAERRPLVVAHVDHGIRADSSLDKDLVERVAKTHNLPFVSTKLRLGSDTSEEYARTRRYEWLEEICDKYHGEVIATAHHQDDVLETIAINLVRGTAWRGLCSLRSTTNRYRPLLGTSKAKIASYAVDHAIEWREDTTNASHRYLRNRIRTKLNILDPAVRRSVLKLYDEQVQIRETIETDLRFLHKEKELDRHFIQSVPSSVGREIVRTWLPYPLEQRRLNDLLGFMGSAKKGDLWSLDAVRFVKANRDTVVVQSSRD